MRFRSLIACVAALAAAGCGGGEVRSPRASTPPGDIILVTIDTWRADAAGFAGEMRVKTPFLDSLAARGVVFTNAHAHNVVTLPSHANILTGLNPYQHGVRENAGFVLEDSHVTLAERLRAQGYATAAFIAAYPLDAKYGLRQGFDVYDDNYGKGRATLDFTVQERSAAAVLEPASQWWRQAEGRKRFLWVHLYEPHAPYAPPEPFRTEYRDHPYLGEVAAADDALGRFLAPLIRDDTTVIVTSDHGEALGDHGETTHGLFAYEATLKVPLLVVAPGLAARREPQSARHIDIAPTILDRAGITVPAELPGQSLLGPIQPGDTYFEALSSSLNRGWAPLTGLIQAGVKYIDLPIGELYDLAADPRERQNLIDVRRREAAAARRVLASLPLAPPARKSISAEEAARLRSLGYIAGAPSSKRITIDDDPKRLVEVDSAMHEVIDHYQRGDLAGALRIARGVVAKRPGMAAGSELLAFVLQQSERVDEAIGILGRLAAEGEASEAAKIQLALLLTERGKAADAAAIFASMAPLDNPDALNGYGIVLADLGRPADAVAQFRRALEIDPNSAPAFQNLGILALRGNDLRAAEGYLGRALALNPRLPLALNTLGVVRARRHDLDGAVAAWKEAVAVDPRQYDALYNIGLVEGRAGRTREAREALEQFVRTAPPQRYGAEIANARRALASLH